MLRRKYPVSLNRISHGAYVLLTGLLLMGLGAAAADEGQIAGTVTDASGQPVAQVLVMPFHWNGTYWQQGPAAIPDSVGQYTIGGLDSRNYRVCFTGIFTENYLFECYDDAPDVESAADIGVTVGSTTSGIDAALAVGGKIAGTVTDASGNPVANVDVSAHHWDGQFWQSVPYVSTQSTDPFGQYTIVGLASGNYRVCFHEDETGNYFDECYNDALDVDSADDVAVTAGSTTTGIDAELAVASRIMGTVTDASGNPAASVWVDAYFWNGSWWDSVGSSYISSYPNDGQYRIGGLAAGAYRVCFRDSSGTYPYECYNDAADVESADDVPVAAGGTTSVINAQLGLAGDSEREGRLQLYLRTIISTL